MQMEQLERVLKTPLEMKLSASFTQDVVKIVMEQRKAEERRARMVYFISVFSFLLASAIGLLVFIPGEMKKTIVQILPWGLLIGAMALIFEWIDQRYIRKKLSY